MKLLVLGGTIFLGRWIVDAAASAGHEVTIFHRGNHNRGLPDGVVEILGDRTENLDPLAAGEWDAVLDTSGYVPRVVAGSAEALLRNAGWYGFVSTVSVYASFREAGLDETAPVAVLADPSTEEVTGETYGGLKALCEAEVKARFGNRALVARPGLIVGPYDPSDRFTYWPWRTAQGGTVLAPGRPSRQVQFVDVRDLAGWLVRCAEQGLGGTYNAVGPEGGATFGTLLDACVAETGAETVLEWVPDEFLATQEADLPFYIAESETDWTGIEQIDGSRAHSVGLVTRPIVETVRDTVAWMTARPATTRLRAGMDLETESGILERWRLGSQ